MKEKKTDRESGQGRVPSPGRSPQTVMLSRQKSAYGGELRNTRMGRATARPLATRQTMHLVLRSSKAQGDWSFRHPRNRKRVSEIISWFAKANGVRVLSLANVGNHLHLHIKLGNRFSYASFIRAATGAIALAVTGRTRWSQIDKGEVSKEGVHTSSELRKTQSRTKRGKLGFWDYRPFTRIIEGFRAVLALRDYIRINQLEGFGLRRNEARAWIMVTKNKPG